jgi:hypothetical protein
MATAQSKHEKIGKLSAMTVICRSIERSWFGVSAIVKSELRGFHLLNRRFGEIDSSIINRIQVLSTEELEVLGEEFLGFADVSALLDWLDRGAKSDCRS